MADITPETTSSISQALMAIRDWQETSADTGQWAENTDAVMEQAQRALHMATALITDIRSRGYSPSIAAEKDA